MQITGAHAQYELHIFGARRMYSSKDLYVQVVESTIPPYLTVTVTNETVGDLAAAQLQETYPMEDGICNVWMAGLSSPLERFIFVVNFFTHNGFYVAIVQQSNYEPITVVCWLTLQ